MHPILARATTATIDLVTTLFAFAALAFCVWVPVVAFLSPEDCPPVAALTVSCPVTP